MSFPLQISPTDLDGMYVIWQYGLWSFQAGGTKLERFLHKNKEIINLEFWINGELSKIGHHFSIKVI